MDIMEGLDHPFIVSIIEHFQTHEHQFIVMELVRGKTLDAMLDKSKKLPVDQVQHIMSELLLAISCMHGLGIIYRDLKPDNVMITNGGHVKLTDFGVSFKTSKTKKTSHRRIGGKGFKAPEMLAGQEYGISVDWWNFGVMLHVMLSGEHPFKSTGLFSRDEDSNTQKKPPNLSSLLSPEAKDLISKLLEKNPKLRLGCSASDPAVSYPEKIQRHAFFAGVDWRQVLETGHKVRNDCNGEGDYPANEDPTFSNLDAVINMWNASDPEAILEQGGW